MARILLTPVLIGGWLTGMYEAVAQAADRGLDAEVEGEIEGALAVNRDGKAALLLKLQAEASEEAMVALLGGAPLNVEGGLEVGWSNETKVGRMAWGRCRARFATRAGATSGA